METIAQLMAQDQQHSWHPYSQGKEIPTPLPVVGAKGALLELADGSYLIDAVSSWWTNLHGHGHPYIREKVFDQWDKVDHVMFAGLTHEPAIKLGAKLSEILPGNPGRHFFSDNGSTSVETAIKIALQYQMITRGPETRPRIITLRNGYHGETFGAMSVSSRSFFSSNFSSLLFDVEWIDPPQTDREGISVQQLRKILRGPTPALFIFEPWVQGVGGMCSYSMRGLEQLLQLCRNAGVITIADEVFTGCGRLGPYFACSQLATAPDITCLAKSLTGGTLPLAVTSCQEWIFEKFLSSNKNSWFLHGHSYTANTLGCAAALASLDLLLTDACNQQRRRIESRHQRVAKKWGDEEKVVDIEVIGTLLAFSFRSESDDGYFDSLSQKLFPFYQERGVLLRPFGNRIHLLPPYCISEKQLDQVYNVIEESFDVV